VYRRAQVALERIAEDLAAAVLDEDVDFIGRRDSFNGEPADSLRFTSMAHIVFDPENDSPGLAYITYTVEQDEEDSRLLVLLRGDQRLGPVKRDGDQREQPEDPPGLLLSDRLRFRWRPGTLLTNCRRAIEGKRGVGGTRGAGPETARG